MRYEPTQRGNPHRLTINQHIFPVASIARFIQANGFVSVFIHEQQKIIRCRPRDIVFCARRAWNQASEQGFMKKIEDVFQVLANQILNSTIGINLGLEEQEIISNFYALCRLRAQARLVPSFDVLIKDAQLENLLTKDKEEILEKNGYAFSRGVTMPSRHVTSAIIQAYAGKLVNPETTWGVIYSRDIEFVVPDSFCEVGIVSLSPNYCLVANQRNGEISADNAIAINQLAVKKSFKYYFARDFSKCGI